MPRVSPAEFKAILAKVKARKRKRKANARFIARASGKKPLESRSKLRSQIWHFTSLIVRRRDSEVAQGRCLVCRRNPIQCAYHIVPAVEGDSTRYDLDNIVGACAACNYREMRWRRRQREVHVRVFGEARMAALEARASKIVKLDRADLVALRDARRRMYEIGNDERAYITGQGRLP